MYGITIIKRDNHFDVQIGCKHYFLLTAEAVAAEVGAYLINHEAAERAHADFQRSRGIVEPTVAMPGALREPDAGHPYVTPSRADVGGSTLAGSAVDKAIEREVDRAYLPINRGVPNR